MTPNEEPDISSPAISDAELERRSKLSPHLRAALLNGRSDGPRHGGRIGGC